MSAFANAVAPPQTDGAKYTTDLVMPALEGDLFNQALPRVSPIPVLYGQAIVATIELSVTGSPSAQTTYVVLQTDLGDGVWYDLAWCLWLGTSGSKNFLLAAGMDGANAVQQTRDAGTAPASSDSVQVPLGGRIRFVGKSSISSGSGDSSSSSSAGDVQQVTCSIRYKILGLR